MFKRGFLIIGVLLLSVLLLFSISLADDTDPVISFYLDNLDYVFNQQYIFKIDSGFSCRVSSILEKTNYRGKPDKTDTTIFRLFYNHGKMDSSTIIDTAKIEDNILPSDFIPPLVWRDSLQFGFYPNDTGSGTLAISFESKSMDSANSVTGFISLNRADFYIEKLFLHYPHPENYDRISEIYTFEQSGEFIYLRKLELHRSKVRFFGREFTKQVIDFSDYRAK